MSMNIHAEHGAKVVFTGNDGYEWQKEKANRFLKVGKVYEVDFTNVFSYNTDVYLVGFDEPFNSVHFEDFV